MSTRRTKPHDVAGQKSTKPDSRQLGKARLRERRKPGKGRPFAPGQNSHDGTVHRRGKDLYPRKMGLFYQCLLEDDGSMAKEIKRDKSGRLLARLGRSYLKAADDPRLALMLSEMFADRLEGKPVQLVHVQERRTTIFQGPPSESPSGAPNTPPLGPADPESMVPVRLPETVEPETEFRRR